jgi:Arc/MetJ-type ribon-helix-helix transcriptional regulator
VAVRTIALSDKDGAPLGRLVASGGYRSADEAPRESLKLAEIAQVSEPVRLPAFKAAIMLGRNDVAAGREARGALFLGRGNDLTFS